MTQTREFWVLMTYAVALAAFLAQVGALQTAPVLLAVITAYLAMEGVRYFVASRQRTSTVAADKRAPA